MNGKFLTSLLCVLFLLAACAPVAPVDPTPLPTLTNTPTLIVPTNTQTAGTDTAEPMPPVSGDTGPKTGPLGEFQVTDPTALYWNAAGTTLGVASAAGLALFDVETMQPAGSLAVAAGERFLDAALDAQLAAVSTPDGQIKIVDITTGQPVQQIQPDPPIIGRGDLTNDGQILLTDTIDQMAARLWSVETGQLIDTLSGFETAAPVYSVQYASNDQALIWWARATVQLQDLEDGQMGPQFSHEDFITSYDLSPDGSLLAAAAGGTVGGEYGFLVHLWDTASGEKTAALPQEGSVNVLQFSPDGGVLAVAVGNKIFLWDPLGQSIIRPLEGHAEGVTLLRYSPDGRYLASASFDGSILIWSTDLPEY